MVNKWQSSEQIFFSVANLTAYYFLLNCLRYKADNRTSNDHYHSIMKKRHLFKQLPLQNNESFIPLFFFSTCICRKKFQPCFKIKQKQNKKCKASVITLF